MTTTVARRVTAADVAKAAGVSRATVGFVLNGTKGQTISEATATKVRDAAAKLGYTPHSHAQALRSGRSKIVLMVLPDWPLDHQMRIYLEEVAQVLDDAGLTMVTHTHRSNRQQSRQPIWAAINPLAVVGLEPFSASEINSMRRLNIVSIVPSPDQDAELALQNNEVFDALIGHQLQVQHLMDRGHRRLSFALPADHRLRELAHARLEAIATACEAHGLKRPHVLTPIPKSDDQTTFDLRGAIEEGVTAVIGYNDDVAADVIGAANIQGLNVPRDLAVMGHDDSPLAARFIPSITSIRIDHHSLGQYVGNLVLQNAGLRDEAPLPRVGITVAARDSTSGFL